MVTRIRTISLFKVRRKAFGSCPLTECLTSFRVSEEQGTALRSLSKRISKLLGEICVQQVWAKNSTASLAPAGGTKAFKQGAYWHVHLYMKRQSVNGLRVPKKRFQGAQKPTRTRNGTPKPHQNAYFRGPRTGLPKTIFGGFPSPTPPQYRSAKLDSDESLGKLS